MIIEANATQRGYKAAGESSPVSSQRQSKRWVNSRVLATGDGFFSLWRSGF